MAVALKMRKSDVTLVEAFQEFVRYTRARNKKEKTIQNYEKQFKKFKEWYGDKDISFINSDTIIFYIEYLQNEGSRLKPVSINTSIRHLKAIINYWSNEREYIRPFKIRLLDVDEEPKEVYTEKEIASMLKKPNTKKCTFQEYRTWAVVNFFIGTGCRVSTLVNIKIKDVDFHNGLIQYRHNKNGRLQYVPISSALEKVLGEYLQVRGGNPDDLLFPSEDDKQLEPTTITHNIKKYCADRGLREGNSHLFRHTYAKNWLVSGGDSIKLMKILGHQSLDMVEHYANLYKHDLKVGYEDYDLLSKVARGTTKIKVN